MNVRLTVGTKVKFKRTEDGSQYTGVVTSISNHGVGIVALINGELECYNGQKDVKIVAVKRKDEDWITE